MKILIVDDSAHFRAALRAVLEFQPFVKTIDECTDGDEVLPYLSNNSDVDCILMDISMKRMDGLTASREVKKAYPTIPIIILSMHDEESYYASAKEIGVSDFLLKSTELKALVAAIEKAVHLG